MKGFSTQKLSSRLAAGAESGRTGFARADPEGIPFNVGIWEGPDGRTILAALNPGGYGRNIATDLSKEPAPGAGRGGEDRLGEARGSWTAM